MLFCSNNWLLVCLQIGFPPPPQILVAIFVVTKWLWKCEWECEWDKTVLNCLKNTNRSSSFQLVRTPCRYLVRYSASSAKMFATCWKGYQLMHWYWHVLSLSDNCEPSAILKFLCVYSIMLLWKPCLLCLPLYQDCLPMLPLKLVSIHREQF